jgi:two-component system, NtrC family, sensor kinase
MSLSVQSKIIIGNGCVIAFAIVVILIGYETGDYYQYQALHREMLVQEYRQAIDNFQMSLLLTRTHWQEMSELDQKPELFQEEYDHFQQYLHQSRQDWQTIQALSDRPNPLLRDIKFIDQTRSLLSEYADVPAAYFQEVDMTSAASDRPGQPPSPRLMGVLFKQVRESGQFQAIAQQLDALSDALVSIATQAQADLVPITQSIKSTDELSLWASSSGISLAILVGAYLSWRIARSITRPLKQVTTIAQLITQEARFDLRIDQRGRDEVGQLAKSLNLLITRVQELLWEQLAAQGELAGYNQELESMVTDRTQALEERNLELKNTLSELKVTQAQLVQTAKMSSLSQLVAGIAHEFNNPLTFVASNLPHAQTGFQNLMAALNVYQQARPQLKSELEDQLTELDLEYLLDDLPKMLTSMSQGTSRLQSIVENLRHFSHLDESEYKSVNLHDGIDSALLLLKTRLRSTIPDRPIEIIKQYDDLPNLNCYASQLNQVFMDLLNNAITALQAYAHHAPIDWQPQITISTNLSRKAAHNTIQLMIWDNGIGITPENLPHIFEPFFTTQPVGHGMGLGLSLAYQVISAHGGTLTCESEPHQGCIMAIALPLIDLVSQPATIQSALI